MPVLRQLTDCSAPATHVVEARSRAKGRAVEYRVEVCARHRWLARQWPGRRAVRAPGGRCGTMLDHRPYLQVVQSHLDTWILPLTALELDMGVGEAAPVLRAAHTLLQKASGDHGPGRGDIWHAVAAALGHAAWLAEVLAADLVEAEAGQGQVLAALSVAELLDGTARGV